MKSATGQRSGNWWFAAALKITKSMVLVVASVPHTHAQQADSRPDDRSALVQTQMRNVIFHFTDNAAVHIKSLEGELVPVAPAEFPVFDKKDSFRLRIRSGEIAVTAADLGNIFNSYVFARANTPLSGVSITVQNGYIKFKGKLHEAGSIPFETDGSLSPTPEGKILLRTEKVKALHVPVKGLMNLFGVEIADLIKNGKLPGVQSEGDNLILDPSLVFPAPHMEGKVTAIRIEGETIVLTFGERNRAVKYLQTGNYMSYRGNRLRFGKLTMADADMILIDMDPNDPLDFYLDHYKEQLSAGYSKTTGNSGLRVFVKDFNKLARSGAAAKENNFGDAKQ